MTVSRFGRWLSLGKPVPCNKLISMFIDLNHTLFNSHQFGLSARSPLNLCSNWYTGVAAVFMLCDHGERVIGKRNLVMMHCFLCQCLCKVITHVFSSWVYQMYSWSKNLLLNDTGVSKRLHFFLTKDKALLLHLQLDR